LVVAEKKESQDICFVENGNVEDFINNYLNNNNLGRNQKKGTFRNKNGETLGAFEPNASFTIGQRKGLNLALGHPVYVTDIDKENNIVTVGEKEDLLKTEIYATDFNWISIDPKAHDRIRCTAKIRYNMKDIPAVATCAGENSCTITFPDGISAPARGQSIVLYDGEIVLGGGYIQKCK
jgi:tRNA-uridine 2-sulfurtransferase